MLISIGTVAFLLLAFGIFIFQLFKKNKVIKPYYQQVFEENIHLPPARITGIACLLMLIGSAFATATLYFLQWPFNFYSFNLYINLVALAFSFMMIYYALHLYLVRNGVIQLQFTKRGIWVPDLQPPVRRHLFLDLLTNKKFKLIEYNNICRAEYRETLSGSQVVLIETTGSTTLAVYLEDKYDADKIIKKINNRATGIDVMNIQ